MIRAFPQDPATSQAMKEAIASDFPSVRFMAMTAQLGLAASVEASTSGP
jgi:hypothetical protein